MGNGGGKACDIPVDVAAAGDEAVELCMLRSVEERMEGRRAVLTAAGGHLATNARGREDVRVKPLSEVRSVKPMLSVLASK